MELFSHKRIKSGLFQTHKAQIELDWGILTLHIKEKEPTQDGRENFNVDNNLVENGYYEPLQVLATFIFSYLTLLSYLKYNCVVFEGTEE